MGGKNKRYKAKHSVGNVDGGTFVKQPTTTQMILPMRKIISPPPCDKNESPEATT